MNSKIEVKLPEGYNIEVQESAHLPEGILLLTNGEKRLYVKLCPESEIMKGYIFEIVNPTDFKKLGIEETVAENTNLYKEKGLIIEETASDDAEHEKIVKETDAWMEEQKKKNAGQVTINIVGQKPKGSEDKTPTSEEFAEEAEFERKLRLLNQGLKKVEQEDALAEAEENEYNVKDSGKGTLPLSKAQREHESNRSDDKSFGSHSELISHLKSEIRKGNETAKEQYVQLVNKCLKGLKEKSVVWQDGENGESMISYTLNERNKRLREQVKKSKGEN